MKKRFEKGLFWGLVLLILSGCGASAEKIINPYESEFSCPLGDKGKCASVRQAYQESVEDLEDVAGPRRTGVEETETYVVKELVVEDRRTPGWKRVGPGRVGTKRFVEKSRPKKQKGPEELYREQLLENMSGRLMDRGGPEVLPARVLRVLILPYGSEDGKRFYQERWVDVIVQDPVWLLENLQDRLK